MQSATVLGSTLVGIVAVAVDVDVDVAVSVVDEVSVYGASTQTR